MTPYTEKRRSKSKETVAAIIMLYRNTKVNVCTPEGDRLLQYCRRCAVKRHISPIPLIIGLDYVLRTSFDKIKDNGFEVTKERIKIYPAQTITDADYADDIALLVNTPA